MLPPLGISKKGWKTKTNASAGREYIKALCSLKKITFPLDGNLCGYTSDSKFQKAKSVLSGKNICMLSTSEGGCTFPFFLKLRFGCSIVDCAPNSSFWEDAKELLSFRGHHHMHKPWDVKVHFDYPVNQVLLYSSNHQWRLVLEL